MRRSAVTAFALVATFLACESDPPPRPSASAAPARQDVDLAGACKGLCRRAAACGLEAAEAAAAGQPKDVALLEGLKREEAKTAETCAAKCAASDTPDPADLAPATACLEQTSCATFERCLTDAAKKARGGT